MGWHELQSGDILISEGIAESSRFGCRVLDIQCGQLASERSTEISKALVEREFDLAVVRFPSQLERVGIVLADSSHKVIFSDPTVYWGKTLRNDRTHDPLDGVSFKNVGIDEIEKIEELIIDSFDKYRAHWHYNPRTAHLRMSDAYIEWVGNLIQHQHTNCYLMLVGDTPAGFAFTETRNSVCEILLAGISSRFQAQGLYGQLLAYVENSMISQRINNLVISTQSQNTNVQKAWVRSGLFPTMTIHNAHVEK